MQVVGKLLCSILAMFFSLLEDTPLVFVQFGMKYFCQRPPFISFVRLFQTIRDIDS